MILCTINLIAVLCCPHAWPCVCRPVPVAAASGAGGSAKPAAAAAPAKPPRLECIKKRWYIEYQTGQVTVPDAAADHEVYIHGCVGATITITNKIKTMTIDSCKRTQVIFEAAISACEVRVQ